MKERLRLASEAILIFIPKTIYVCRYIISDDN